MSRKNCLRTRRTADDTDPALLDHLRSLGLSSVAEYRCWCSDHGFSPRTNKDWRQRSKEHYYATADRAKERLSRLRQEAKNPADTLRRIHDGTLVAADLTQPRFVEIALAFQRLECKSARRAYLRLLLQALRQGPGLLSVEPVVPVFGDHPDNSYINALAMIAKRFATWRGLPEHWKPQTRNTHRQFSSLVRHLFAKYTVPGFMDSIWFKGGSEEAVRQQDWYLHLGRGHNIRTAELPLPYTKRMAHHFMQAPSHLTVEEALRWGQVIALGGDTRTANAVLSTDLVRNFQHDEFWVTVLRWLIAHPMLDPVQIGPIIDYVRHRRFASEETINDAGVVQRRPLEAGFTMKGRTPEALLRRVQEWHNDLGKATSLPDMRWEPTGIGWLIHSEKETESDPERLWTIRELSSRHELAAEGRYLRHCVATYADSCRQGHCSIWSLGVQTGQRRKRMVTIEVRNRVIVQVRGKANRLPRERECSLIRRWATQEGLTVAEHVG